MSIETIVSGQMYRISDLDPFKQFHVVRRIGPVLAAMGLSLSELATKLGPQTVMQGAQGGESGTNGPGMGDADLLEVLTPVMEVVSKMKDEDVDYVTKTCMSAVQRSSGSAWAPVLAGGRLMFADISMPVMIQLTVEVIKHNLGDFFSAPPGAQL